MSIRGAAAGTATHPGFGHVDTAAGDQQAPLGQIIDPGRRRKHDVERLASAEPPDDLVGPGPDRGHLVPARFLECRRQFAESRLERAGADDLDLGGIRDGDHRRARDAECGRCSHFHSHAHEGLTFPPATPTLVPPALRHQVTFRPICEEGPARRQAQSLAPAPALHPTSRTCRRRFDHMRRAQFRKNHGPFC
jgi:hypothetical protein